MTAVPVERQFPTFDQGELREAMLANFRLGVVLAGMINPDTNQPFTAVELATATAKGSPKWIDAEGIDLVCLAGQARALWLADQIRPDTASTSSLTYFHGDLWDETFLPAAGGSGDVLAEASAGTTFVGSTTIGDPVAIYGTAPDQKRYQVLFTRTVAPGETSVVLTLVGIDTGEQTNLVETTQILWSNPPLGASTGAVVTTQFTGGVAAETDEQFARRLIRRIRYKQGAGVRAQMRAWAEKSFGNAVESAFVYACFMHAGSTLIAITQKRASNVRGPLGRIPSAGTLAQVIAYMTPPGSPVVPSTPYVLVTACTPVSSNLVLEVSMPTGSPAGFADFQPWPGQAGGTPPTVTAVTSQTEFQITSLVALPSGVTRPAVMLWDDSESRFYKLAVDTVTLNAGNVYDVVLTQEPTGHTIAVGDYASPYSERAGSSTSADLLGATIENYFDSLGPGELIDVSSSSTDARAHRAHRFPKPNEEFAQRAGATVINFLQDALGASFTDGALAAVSVSSPPLPADVSDGPSLLVAGKVSISAL